MRHAVWDERHKAQTGRKFSKHLSEKGLAQKSLILHMSPNSLELNNEKTNQPILKSANELKRHCTKEESQLADNFFEKMFSLLFPWEAAKSHSDELLRDTS